MRTSTLSPNSEMSGASRDAHDAFGVSLVPLKASVRKETRRLGFFRRDSRIVSMRSCSVLPM